jgi:hypothetical protein
MISDNAIAAAAAWWAKVLENPKFDALGGTRDRSMEFAQVLMSRNAALNRPQLDALVRFQSALATGIRKQVYHDRCTLSVDYGPDRVLAEAAATAGLANGLMFPCKTTMWIDSDGVRVSYGYRAPQEVVFSEGPADESERAP